MTARPQTKQALEAEFITAADLLAEVLEGGDPTVLFAVRHISAASVTDRPPLCADLRRDGTPCPTEIRHPGDFGGLVLLRPVDQQPVAACICRGCSPPWMRPATLGDRMTTLVRRLIPNAELVNAPHGITEPAGRA